MATKAHLEGNKRYHEKLDEIKVRIPKGNKEIIQNYAKSKGKSLNSFITETISKEMNYDINAQQPTQNNQTVYKEGE